jgi:hypothetical protein
VQPDLIIPDACVPYIRWQRSRYSEAKVPDPNEVKLRYAAHVAEDFAGMEPHLPARVDTILEIGCGMAAIQVFLKLAYPHARLELLDGDGENVVGDYRPTSEPYNSRAHTEMLLGANGVRIDRWIDVGTKEHLRADLVLSMASLGYHYPLSTYRFTGLAIMDLRRGRETRRGTVIFRGPKYDRCMWRAE